MNIRKIIDLDENAFDDNVRSQIAALVALGHKREVLVINNDNRVFVDPELAREEGYLDVRYGQDEE